MIDSLLNLVFRCSHRRLTRPVTPVSKAGIPHGETYVVCLDCGKQFRYDLQEMRVGKPLESSHEGGVLPPGLAQPPGQKIRYALWASVPLALLIGTVLKTKKPGDSPRKPEEPQRRS